MQQTAGATTQSGSDRRTWLIGAVAVAAVILIAVAAVVLTGMRQDAVYEPGSPEAAVQDYVEAWAAGDASTAWEMLTPQAQARVDEFEFHHARAWEEDLPTRVWIDERQDLPDWVALTLSVEWTWDGLFGPDRHLETVRLKLIEQDGAWRIDTPLLGFHRW